MMPHDAFTDRLSQGLQRWANHGQPTLDLEAFVRAQGRARRRRWWLRWAGSLAAAVALMLGLSITFPRWAGAAADWPIVGPVVTEIIMKDAGLKWAYDQGTIQHSLAEAKLNGTTVRILGFVANQARLTVIYQIPDWPKPPETNRLMTLPASHSLLGELAIPVPEHPWVSIARVGGVGTASWGPAPLWTPMGLVGTVETLPLEKATAPVELVISDAGQKAVLNFTVTRNARGARSITPADGLTLTHDGMTVSIQGISSTPAETLIRYRVQGRRYMGSVAWSNHDGTSAVETAAGRVDGRPGPGIPKPDGSEDFYDTFPVSQLPRRFILPTVLKGVDADLTWPLQNGSTQEFAGNTITLKSWERAGDQIAFEWTYTNLNGFVGFNQLEVVDANGQVYPLQFRTGSMSSGAVPERRTFAADLPASVKPVAVRAHEAGMRVDGPWVFTLPK